MTFAYPLLLGGLLLVGLPVLIHLLMRPKPKRLPFPAFRFLLQKRRTNQRSLRLRHLLLLLLRMAVIALLCLALGRPRLTSETVLPALMGDRPVHAILLVDTSPSMEYDLTGKSWLDEARRRALEVVDELPEGSRIAILDSGDVGGDWAPTVSLARERIHALRVRYANAPLTTQLEQAYRLFADLAVESTAEEEPPRVLYLISDRTRACWDTARARALKHPDDVTAVFVDVGAEGVSDVAITEVKPERTTFWPGETVSLQVTVRASGKDCDTEVVCVFDGEAQGEKRPLKLSADRSEVVTFFREAGPKGLAEGLHQVEVRLVGGDPLAFNNTGHATFRILGGRRVLVLCDDPQRDAAEWRRRLARAFQVEVRPATDAPTLELSTYSAVLMAHLQRPREDLWKQLESYAISGGGIAILPAEQAALGDYTSDSALRVVPGRFLRTDNVAELEGKWQELERDPQRLNRHPLLSPFARWRAAGIVDFLLNEATKPTARRFWKAEPLGEGTQVLTRYTDADGSPALLERILGRGRILLLTTPLEPRRTPTDELWTNYFGLNSSFGLVLTNLIVGYLAGDANDVVLNFLAGQTVTVPLPMRPFFPRYTLTGPGVVGSDADLPRQTEQKDLRVVQAVTPGSFTILDGDGRPVSAFSMACPAEESNVDRVPVEEIEDLLGPESLLPVGRTAQLGDLLKKRGGTHPELAPFLLALLLAALAMEGWLANRFYRRSAEDEQSARSP